MLDANIDKIFSIEASLPGKGETVPKVLLLRACRIYLFGDDRIYSEFEEQTFNVLNGNRGLGALDIEFIFENNIIEKAYPQFYTKCFVMRTDAGDIIKPMKYSNVPSESKVNSQGELVVGIRYFFREEMQIQQIMECKEILVEGFIALGRPTNVFGVMCQLHKGKKNKKKWKISSAYTYKPSNAKNIKWLID